MWCSAASFFAVPTQRMYDTTTNTNNHQDPNTRASLLDKLKATVAVAQEAIKVIG